MSLRKNPSIPKTLRNKQSVHAMSILGLSINEIARILQQRHRFLITPNYKTMIKRFGKQIVREGDDISHVFRGKRVIGHKTFWAIQREFTQLMKEVKEFEKKHRRYEVDV